MKKSIILILFMMICFSVAGCGKSEETNSENQDIEEAKADTAEEETEDPKQVALEAAKTAYAALNSVSEISDSLASKVYSAWEFSITEDDKYTLDFSGGHLAFSKAVGIDDSKMLTAINETLENTSYGYLGEKYYGQSFKEAAYCVAFVERVYKNDGIIENNDSLLNDAKEAIKIATSNDPDAEYIEELKNYYSEVQSYYEFAKSPTGNYMECGETIENYRKELNNYKNKLSFDLE